MSRLGVGRRGEEQLWTETYQARPESRLKNLISGLAADEITGWLAWADPPRSSVAMPIRREACGWCDRVALVRGRASTPYEWWFVAAVQDRV